MQKTLEIRVYDGEGKRRRFPSSYVESVKWELSDRGYFGNFTVELKDDFDGSLSIYGGDRLEVWLDGTRRYRGYVAVPEQQLEIPEKRVITGHGLAERLNSIRVDKQYMYHTEVDASVIFRSIVEDYLLSRISGIVIDAQIVDFATDEFSAKDTDARSAIDQLVEVSGKQAVWGVDIDPETGGDRIFLRPRSTEEKYKFQVGGRVKSYSYPPDYSKIVNRVHLTGGKSKYPNLVKNPSFESLVGTVADEPVNTVPNSGFENGRDGWSMNREWGFGGGGDVWDTISHSGSKSLRIFHMNGIMDTWFWFTNDFPVDPVVDGAEHNISFWWYKPNTTMEHQVMVKVLDMSNGEAVIFATNNGDIDGNVGWNQYSCTISVPAGCTEIRVMFHARTDSYDGVCFDDIAFAPASWTNAIHQEYWEVRGDTDVAAENEKAVATESCHGAYSVGLNVISIGTSGHYSSWWNTADAVIDVDHSAEYTFSARVKGTAPCNVSLILWVINDSGSGRYVESPSFAVDNSGWTHCYMNWTSNTDDDRTWVGIKLAEVGHIYIDAVMFARKNPNDPTGACFITGEDWEWKLSTGDDFIQNDAALPDAVKGSIATYGLREAKESAGSITKTSQAESWARGYFGVNAQPVASHKLTIVDPGVEIKPDGHVKLLGVSTPSAFPVKVSYSLGGDNVLGVSVELSTERPSFELLLAKMARR